jgi:hypothetical protein
LFPRKKDLICSLGQLKFLLLEDMIILCGKKSLNHFPKQLKLLFLKDMIVPREAMNFPRERPKFPKETYV